MTSTERIAASLATAMRRQGITARDLSGATGIPEARLTDRLAHPDGFRLGDFYRVTHALDLDPLDLF